jgi:hypothetical protein
MSEPANQPQTNSSEDRPRFHSSPVSNLTGRTVPLYAGHIREITPYAQGVLAATRDAAKVFDTPIPTEMRFLWQTWGWKIEDTWAETKAIMHRNPNAAQLGVRLATEATAIEHAIQLHAKSDYARLELAALTGDLPDKEEVLESRTTPGLAKLMAVAIATTPSLLLAVADIQNQWPYALTIPVGLLGAVLFSNKGIALPQTEYFKQGDFTRLLLLANRSTVDQGYLPSQTWRGYNEFLGDRIKLHNVPVQKTLQLVMEALMPGMTLAVMHNAGAQVHKVTDLGEVGSHQARVLLAARGKSEFAKQIRANVVRALQMTTSPDTPEASLTLNQILDPKHEVKRHGDGTSANRIKSIVSALQALGFDANSLLDTITYGTEVHSRSFTHPDFLAVIDNMYREVYEFFNVPEGDNSTRRFGDQALSVEERRGVAVLYFEALSEFYFSQYHRMPAELQQKMDKVFIELCQKILYSNMSVDAPAKAFANGLGSVRRRMEQALILKKQPGYEKILSTSYSVGAEDIDPITFIITYGMDSELKKRGVKSGEGKGRLPKDMSNAYVDLLVGVCKELKDETPQGVLDTIGLLLDNMLEHSLYKTWEENNGFGLLKRGDDLGVFLSKLGGIKNFTGLSYIHQKLSDTVDTWMLERRQALMEDPLIALLIANLAEHERAKEGRGEGTMSASARVQTLPADAFAPLRRLGEIKIHLKSLLKLIDTGVAEGKTTVQAVPQAKLLERTVGEQTK